MPINFCSKKIFIRKIILKENKDFYFFEGEYNIKRRKSYIQIKKLNFNENNYKHLYSERLRDILTFSDSINNEENSSPDKNNDTKNEDKILSIEYNNFNEINSIFGFIKFNMGYYALLACDSEIVGKIGRNIIYRVDKLKFFPLFQIDENFKKSEEWAEEKKYMNLVQSFSYDKQLYFSYSYNLTNPLQRNFVESFKKDMVYNFVNEAYKNIVGKISLEKSTNYFFTWNYFHIEEFFKLIIEDYENYQSWLNYFIYGYFGQNFCNIKGLWLQISVIARRNRHFAGTRYLKRGITSDGNVANDVETEQILEEVSGWIDRPKISSFIQIRGSIPVYWSQIQDAFYQKPEIKVNLSDIRYDATKRHFSSLIERYGVPCIVFNLTKKIEDGKKQETLLNDLYYDGINYINDSIKDFEKILYYHYDLKYERTKSDFYKQFYEISCPLISKTNLFSFIPDLKNKYNISLQNGVIRTNCIDCLDRTNVFQQILGIAVLIIQLRLIGVNETFPENENETIYGILTGMYKKMGHDLSNQYTGTISLKQSITDHRNIFDKIVDTGYEIMIAIKRSMINYFSDQTKQNAMNLFLGKYKINSGEPVIWNMPCDDTLHKNNHLQKLPEDWYKQNYEKYWQFNLFKDIEGKDKKLEYEMYIKKNIEDENINNKNKIKMSITSKLICKGLYKDQNNSNLDTINYSNYSSSNINEYTIDYSNYIKNKKETKEDEQFEDDSIYRFIMGKKCLENIDYIQNDNTNIIDNNKKEDHLKKEEKNDGINNIKKNLFLNDNNGLPQKLNSFKKSKEAYYTFTSPNLSSVDSLNYYNSKLKTFKEIEKFNLYSFKITEKDLKLIDKFVEPITKSVRDEDLYKKENFDINDDDIKEFLKEKENKNFEELYNYETEEKKEEENNIGNNETIYYDSKTNKFIDNKMRNKNNNEEEDNQNNQEDEGNEEDDEEDSDDSMNILFNWGKIETDRKRKNKRKIVIKRVTFEKLKIDKDYFTDKEKQN